MNKPFTPSSKLFFSPCVAALAALVLLAPAAQAAPYVVKLTQQGHNVVATGSGAIDLTGLTLVDANVTNLAGVASIFAMVNTGEGNEDVYVDYGTSSGPHNFGTGGSPELLVASSAQGDFVALDGYTAAIELGVPHGYISDTALTSGATWDDATFNSLGIIPGTYTWTFGTGADQTFTLETVTSVPEPAVLGMFGCGLLLIGGFVELRRRVA